MDNQFSLPEALEPFRARFLETKQTFIQITAQPARRPKPWESMVGGVPYLPIGTAYPTNSNGQSLVFLAQFNFEEIPELQPFPNKGLLQFYINDDDLYGMDFDDGENQEGFRLLFFPDPIKNTANWVDTQKFQRTFDLTPHHPETSYPLSFKRAEEILPATDYQFWQIFGADFFHQFGAQEWDLSDAFGKAVRAQGHKLGGYAYFTQDDPRRPDDPMLLLFQLDSDEGMDLMWGDMGIGHFFIRESDLKNGNFNRVLYDWDCL